MGVKMLENQLRNHDAFSVATLIYARLRRVSGRVIDALYLAENLDYAHHVIQLAEQTQDPDQSHLIRRLKMVREMSETGQDSQIESENPIQHEWLIAVEPDQQDTYREQSSQHDNG